MGLLEQLGAEGIVMDGLDAVSVGEAVAAARRHAIAHQMTALSVAHNGKPDCRHPERFTATINRLRLSCSRLASRASDEGRGKDLSFSRMRLASSAG